MEENLAIIWMSAGNSYFTEERIKKIFKFAEEKFDKIIILSPDKPAEHNFRALGYIEKKIKKKAKLNSNLLLNRAKRKLLENENKEKFMIEKWENISKNKYYKEELKILRKLYLKDESFKEDIFELSKKVLNKENKKVNLKEAGLYLIEELAFILSSPKIYSMKNSNYLYHKKLDIFDKLVSGKYDKIKRKNIFFIKTNIK